MTRHFCDNCGEEAPHLVTVTLGIVQKDTKDIAYEMSLCEECTQKLGLRSMTGMTNFYDYDFPEEKKNHPKELYRVALELVKLCLQAEMGGTDPNQ